MSEVTVRFALLLTLLGTLDSCGGSVVIVAPGGADGAAAVDADSGGTVDADNGGGTEPVGPGTKQYPPALGSGSFFWRYGLGNWFVTKSDGEHLDASADFVNGSKVFKAS